MNPVSGQHWFALRVTYSRELKAQQVLSEKGIRTYVPMRRLRKEADGRVTDRMVPAINNLLFVLSDQQTLYDLMQYEGEISMSRFIWDRVTRQPLIVPDKQMEDFIRVSEVAGDEAIYLSDLDGKFSSGARVRVCFGPLSGVEGKVVRIRKSRRILVELPQIGAVASTYIPMEYLELLPD